MLQAPSRDVDVEAEDYEDERRHFQRIVVAMAGYGARATRRLERARAEYELVSERSRAIYYGLEVEKHLDARQRAVVANQAFLDVVLQAHAPMIPAHLTQDDMVRLVTEFDFDKVKSTLMSCMRDWSEEGAAERRECYTPMIEALQKYVPPTKFERYGAKVLIPGAGAGRLAFDVCQLGYASQGNEFSLFMLIVSDYMLNRLNMHEIHPFALQFSNVRHPSDAIRGVRVPDVNTRSLPRDADFSMTSGDFIDVYGDVEASWHAVLTCFFIDTAKDIVQYLEILWRILVPGGIWINNGPLLYHFEDTPDERSVEISLDDVFKIARTIGFIVIEEATIQTTYTGNRRAMLRYVYDCAFFVAKKPTEDEA